MIVRELDTPHREAKIQIVLQALDVPWLKEYGELTIDGDFVVANKAIVAAIQDDKDPSPGHVYKLFCSVRYTQESLDILRARKAASSPSPEWLDRPFIPPPDET